MSWRDEHGAEELLRRAYPGADREDGGRSLALQVFSSAGTQMEQHHAQLQQLATQRDQLEEAAKSLGERELRMRRARREFERERRELEQEREELAQERQLLRWDRRLNALVAFSLVVWTTQCQRWSEVPPQVTGVFFIVAIAGVAYYHFGRRWLQGD